MKGQLLVLMLGALVLREQILIELSGIENFFSDFETALSFSVRNAVFLDFCLGSLDVLPEDL